LAVTQYQVYLLTIKNDSGKG